MLSLSMDWVEVYHTLYSHYGPQGWWPYLKKVRRRSRDLVSSPEITCHYHPGDYSPPRNSQERFEVAVGAILTQNTTFHSVVECLLRLHRLGGLNPEGLIRIPMEKLISAITPSRYPQRKAKYLLTIADFMRGLGRRIPERRELLDLRGIGEETADSILLYGFRSAEFVIDAYTCRLLVTCGSSPKNYRDAKSTFEEQLLSAFPEKSDRVKVYQEYHALLVEHGKRFYSRKIDGHYGKDISGKKCFLLSPDSLDDKINP